MKSIYVMRHGQTKYNLEGVLQGRAIDAPLNDTGLRQARAFYEHYKNEGFELLLSSSLKRSRESILPFVEKGIPYRIDDRITEFSWGENEGKPLTELVVDKYKEMLSSWYAGDLDARIKGGESGAELLSRVSSFAEDLKKLEENKILICTHGRTLKMLVVTLLGKELKEMESVPHANATLYQLSYDGEVFHLIKENDLSHLAADLKQNAYWDK
jgi:broad specificity phosphatase PhoE